MKAKMERGIKHLVSPIEQRRIALRYLASRRWGYGPEDAARTIGIDHRTINVWVKRHHLPSIKSQVAASIPDGPWQNKHNGKRWFDMPGSNEDVQKLNFFLFRRDLHFSSSDQMRANVERVSAAKVLQSPKNKPSALDKFADALVLGWSGSWN